jgi:hypothetical protein
VVFAAMGTGEEKLASCQPEAVSFVKVTVANFTPPIVHRLPVWVPVLLVPL